MNTDFRIMDPRSRSEQRLSGAAGQQERLAFLNDASMRIGSTLDLAQTCREIMDVAVPRFSDTSAILVHERLFAEGEFPIRSDEGGVLVRLVAHAVAVDNPWDWNTAFPLGERAVFPLCLTQAQTVSAAKAVLVPQLDLPIAEASALALGRQIIAKLLLGCSWIITPLLARGNLLGYFVLLRLAGSEPFQETDVPLAEGLAARSAICIDNARLYSQERSTTLMLQSSLLPAWPQKTPGLEIAHRYLPVGELGGVGGDWFDVIPLSMDRTALVVGDVMGHGIQAAATMGQLRTATLTLASLDLSPGELLLHLNRVAQQLSPDHLATCVYATYDQVTRTFTIASAGHVPPVLIHPSGTVDKVTVAPNMPLGIANESFDTCEISMPAGGVLALYTDGLVESREQNIDEGIAALCSLLTGLPNGIQHISDTIINAQRPVHREDDIALLLAKAL